MRDWLKGQIVAVETGILSFDAVFLPFMLTHDGRTVSGRGGALFNVGDPERVEFFAEGRPATHDEIVASISSGMPTLREMAERDGPDAVAELGRMYDKAMELMP
ncbi:hypothetical protein [Bradyrhizobium sp. AZCC 2289]|uniref:hypothetical protein n=1 Tax=Bradyrhizobium sp. AZCC 2289 TaxID=3117026 RepID=UPI002FEF6815